MNLFPGVSQIQSALLGFAAGALLLGIGSAVLQHKIDNGRYEALVASQATAHSKALTDEAKAATAFSARLTAANVRAAGVQKELDESRLQKQTVLVQTLHDEGKKDATLAHCLSRQLPADVLRNLAH